MASLVRLKLLEGEWNTHGHVMGQAEACCIIERLVDCQRVEKDIVLQHKAHVGFERAIERCSVEGYISGDGHGLRFAAAKH